MNKHHINAARKYTRSKFSAVSTILFALFLIEAVALLLMHVLKAANPLTAWPGSLLLLATGLAGAVVNTLDTRARLLKYEQDVAEKSA